MTLTEQFANNERVKQKASDAYEAGRRDSAAELDALMREGLAQQMADPRYTYKPTPAYPQGQQMLQGGVMPQDVDLRTSNETVMPAPDQSLAARMTR